MSDKLNPPPRICLFKHCSNPAINESTLSCKTFIKNTQKGLPITNCFYYCNSEERVKKIREERDSKWKEKVAKADQKHKKSKRNKF